MSYTEADASSRTAAIEKYRGDLAGEVGAAMAVAGLCSEASSKRPQSATTWCASQPELARHCDSSPKPPASDERPLPQSSRPIRSEHKPTVR